MSHLFEGVVGKLQIPERSLVFAHGIQRERDVNSGYRQTELIPVLQHYANSPFQGSSRILNLADAAKHSAKRKISEAQPVRAGLGSVQRDCLLKGRHRLPPPV